MSHKKHKRREFLEAGIGAGLVLAGATLIRSGDEEKVVLISKEGKLYEISQSKLDENAVKKLKSQEEFKFWLEGGKS